MSQSHSVVSNLDYASRHQHGSELQVVAWFCMTLVTLDLIINILFAYPQNPKITDPSRLRQYFDYGRSIEAKLSRMTRAERTETAPISLVGWYDPLPIVEATPKKPQNSIVTIYGMSHAASLSLALGRVSDRFTPRHVAAPGATSNWAYGAYLRDRGGAKSRAVVLAFQSTNLPMISSLSPMTWYLDAPMPYTADRFLLDGDQLQVIHPPYTSFENYVETLNDSKRWSEASDFFAKNDPLYDPWIVRRTILDSSSLFRLVRRAYYQSFIRSVRHAALDETGFRPESEQVRLARAIIHEFALRARSDGSIPVIFIVNSLGYSDYLFQALSPALHADNVPYLSSHSFASPNDPRWYLPDSHFTGEVDDDLARALERIIVKGDNVPSRSMAAGDRR